MEYTAGDYVRLGFGFANPNHAAAFLCALLPFCWDWRRRAWLGQMLSVLLLAALALTFSRTGFAVFAAEWTAWFLVMRNDPDSAVYRTWWRWALALSLAAACVLWMAPRLSLDGAVTNRPKIWFAGVELCLANPLGVGFGNSGLVASSFLLPEGVEVRTLVNSHLTLMAELGWPVGCAWLSFIASALACGRRMPRAWISFGGLAVSSCVSSVFDWHVLFSGGEAPRHGILNGALSWFLLAVFLGLGFFLAVRGFRLLRVLGVTGGVIAATGVVLLGLPADGVPTVSAGFVKYGKGGPLVMHDDEWGLKTVRRHLPDGACVRIRSGAEDLPTGSAREVWLFGDVAESSDRFPDASVTVVGAPEFYVPGANVKSMISGEDGSCR